MSALWNLEHIRPEPGIVVPGETIPEMFRNAVARRGEAVFMREKELGIWRSWSWNETGRAVRETAMGLAALGFRPGECASNHGMRDAASTGSRSAVTIRDGIVAL